MGFVVYVIMTEDGYHYTGQTPDLVRRLGEHNARICHSTKHGHGWKVVYTKGFATRAEAMDHERWLKSGVGRQWLKENVAGWSPPKAV